MTPQRLLSPAFWQQAWGRYRGFGAWAVSMGGVVFLYFALQNNADAVRHQSLLGAETHRAVCAMRRDLNNRVQESERFIRQHPEGFAGITIKVLRASVAGEEKTIRALRTLPCP